MSMEKLKAKAAAAAAEAEADKPVQDDQTDRPDAEPQAEVAVIEEQDNTPQIPDMAAQDELFNWLKSYAGYWRDLLPAHIAPQAFELSAMAALINSEKLREIVADQRGGYLSFVHSLAMCAHFGLLPDGVQAALVPYKGRVGFVPMYRGYVALMLRTGMIRSVHFDHICEGDIVEIDKGKLPPDDFSHKIDAFKIDTEERVPHVAYAYAWHKDGSRTEVVFMGRTKAEHIRDEYSKAYQNAQKARQDNPRDFAENPWRDKYHSPWHDEFQEMWLKSVVIRLAKRLDLSPILAELIAADAADSTTGQKVAIPARVMQAVARQQQRAEIEARPETEPAEAELLPEKGAETQPAPA